MRPAARWAAGAVIALAPFAAAAQETPRRETTWLQRRIESALAEALGGTARIGRMDVNWTTLSATIGDVAIEVPAEGAPPLTVTIANGSVQLAWSGLTGIAGGEIHLTEVIAHRATFSCSRAWIEAWKPKAKKRSGRAVAVQIDRLLVDDSTAEYVDAGQRTRITTSAMAFRGDWSTSRRLLVGEVQAQTSVEAPLFGRAWPGSVRGGLRLGAGRLEIFGATGEGPGASAELSGNVTWGAGTSFTAQGRMNADLATMSPFIRGHLPLAGRVTGPVQIVFAGHVPIRVTAQTVTENLRIGPIFSESARADITIRPKGMDVANLDARAYGGTFGGTVALSFGQDMVLETALTGKGADLARLIALAGKDLPVGSIADVTLNIRGDPGRVATWTGEGTFDGQPAPGASRRVPTRGRGRVVFDSGRVKVETEALALAEASLRLQLTAELGAPGSTQLSIEGTTRSARTTQLAALQFLDALGVARNRFAVEPLEGAGRLSAEVDTGRSTRVALALDLTAGSYAGESFDRAALDMVFDGKSVELRHVAVEAPGASLAGSARFDAESGALDQVDVKARGVPLSRALAKGGVAASIEALVDGELRGSREGGEFAAEGSLYAHGVIIEREVIDSIEAPLRIEGDRIILDGLTVRGNGLTARGTVIYEMSTREARIDVAQARIDLAANRSLAEAQLTVQGAIETQGSIVVDASGPSGLLNVVCTGLLVDTGRNGLRELRLGDLQGTAAISPRGAEVTVRSMPEPAWTFEGFLGFSRELPLSAVLYFDDLVAGAGGAFGERVDVRLKGQVQAEGDLTRIREMEVNGAFDEVAVRIGPHVLSATEPFPLRLEGGRFVLGPARLAGDTARLELLGSGSLDGKIEGYLRGNIDLAVVSSIWSEIRGQGPVEIDARVAGTMDKPDLQGKIQVAGGRLRVIGYPQSLEAITAEARFEGQTLTLSSFHAFLGGGELQASGSVEFTGVTPTSYNATFSAANVNAAFPAGFKGTYEGTLTVNGTGKRAAISGRIDVVRGLYGRDFDVGLFGGSRREFEGTGESTIPRNIFLDVDIVAPGNVWLRNDVAKVELTGQIHVGGELARPEFTGRMSLVPGGTVRYRDVDYLLDYGTLDLTDPKRINPYVDFRGRTRVAEYEISLHLEGTLEHFDYELTSTPPLSSQDIISLLVTGRTLDTLSGSASAGGLPGDMAAYYFAGLLSSTFGKQIQSTFGIDQLEIAPVLLKGESDPTARVTVGKRVSDTVKIVFSQDIGTTQEQTYQVAWDATRRVKLIAESNSEAGVGGEVQYSRQFGGSPVLVIRPAPAASSGLAADPEGAVGSVQVAAEDGTARADLVKHAKIKVGEPFDRGRTLQGADHIREALVKQGFIQASVRAEAVLDPGPPAAYRIWYRIITGPAVDVEIVMTSGGRTRSLKKTLKAFWRETPYTPDFWDEATHALLTQLQEKGYYAADVTWHATDTATGRGVRIVVDRGKPVRLKAVRFTGASSVTRARLERQMASLKSQALRKRLLRPSVLTTDLAAVRALYRELGYTRVRILPPRVSLSATGDSAEVDVEIEEGPQFSVGEVAFKPSEVATEEKMRAFTPLKSGEVFSPRRLAEAEQALKDRLDELGYPDANVESQVVLSADRADVTFEATAGGRKTVGDIAIEGNKVTREKTIARALTFGQGDVVSRRSMLTSQQQLYRSGLFSNVKLTLTPMDEADPTKQRVTVRVDEAPPISLGLGAGYDSEDGPRASFLFGYANLGGRAVAMTFHARLSEKENQGVLTFRRRRVFGNTIDALGSVVYERTEHDAFTEDRKAIAVRLEHSPKPRWLRFVRYGIQQVEIGDIVDVQAALEQKFEDKLSAVRLGDLGVGLVRDTRDDAFQPTRGGYGSIEASTFAKVLGSQASFVKLFLRGSWTYSFKRGSRFASYLRIGAEEPFAGTAIVPLSERFFAGGSSTLRGFATDTVGPQLFGFNFGGEGLFLLNEEWHFPIWRSLRGELFLDAGNVYPTLSDFDPTNLRSAAGVGLRLETPIGPIRIEYGWKLDRREGETPGELVFAIGTVF